MNAKNKLQQIIDEFKNSEPINESLVKTLYTLSQKSQLAAIILSVLMMIFMYSELSYSIVVWGSLLVVLSLYRLYYADLFLKMPLKYTMKIWYNKFVLFSLLTAMMFSILGTLFIHYLNDYYQLFILASLIGVSAAATASLASDFRIAVVYITIIMLPLIISTTMSHDSLAFILPILLTLFYFSQILMILNSNAQNKEIKELKGQQKLLNNLFSEVPLGMFSYDKDLNVMYANKYLHETFGYKDKALEKLNLHSLADTRVRDIIQKTLTEGHQSFTGEYNAINGDTFWLETIWLPFKDINDHVLGGIGIINDKTQKHKYQNELQSLQLSLQEQVKKNQSLLDDHKEFIAHMVHQIRTPLSVIMTNSSLLEMKCPPTLSFYITQINSAINMLSNSYEDLSYIISNDTLEYKPMEIDLSDFLHERINFFEVIANANEKTITTDIVNNTTITINDIELERLIDNNLSNAIKHSDDKSDIKIILEKINSDIILQFISTGKNVENIYKLFDENYTECSESKRSLGLGLSMVKKICEKNNIYYNADSTDHKNTFTYIFKGKDNTFETKP